MTHTAAVDACTRSSQSAFQTAEGRGSCSLPTEKILMVDSLWRRESQFPLRMWTQVGGSHTSEWPHIQKYMGSTNWSWFFIRKRSWGMYREVGVYLIAWEGVNIVKICCTKKSIKILHWILCWWIHKPMSFNQKVDFSSSQAFYLVSMYCEDKLFTEPNISIESLMLGLQENVMDGEWKSELLQLEPAGNNEQWPSLLLEACLLGYRVENAWLSDNHKEPTATRGWIIVAQGHGSFVGSDVEHFFLALLTGASDGSCNTS